MDSYQRQQKLNYLLKIGYSLEHIRRILKENENRGTKSRVKGKIQPGNLPGLTTLKAIKSISTMGTRIHIGDYNHNGLE